jgi:hypothetical protein
MVVSFSVLIKLVLCIQTKLTDAETAISLPDVLSFVPVGLS